MLDHFERELADVPANRIAFLTFTRSARMEALERSSRPPSSLPYLKTIHAICYAQLGIKHGQMAKLQDLREFGTRIGIEITGNMNDPWIEEDLEYTRKNATPGDKLMQLNHLGRHRMMSLKEAMRGAPGDIDFKFAKWFTLAYREWKNLESLVDYTDLLTEYLERGRPLNIDVMFVDEAQDLSALQWAVVHKLGEKAKRVYIAGDDDQAIFTWAGASAKLFNAEPGEARVLGQSWRVPRSIQALAFDVISRVQDRYPKEWKPREAEGEVTHAGVLDLQHLSHEGTTFVLYRNYHRGSELGKELANLGVAYVGGCSPLGPSSEAGRALAGWWDGVAHNRAISTSNAWAMVNMSNAKWLRLGAATESRKQSGSVKCTDLFDPMPRPDQWASCLSRLPNKNYLAAVIRNHGFDSLVNPRVHLMSIHQSKGRQAETVVLDPCMARATYEEYMINPENEHRVWYVGITRAKERLYNLLPSEQRSYML